MNRKSYQYNMMKIITFSCIILLTNSCFVSKKNTSGIINESCFLKEFSLNKGEVLINNMAKREVAVKSFLEDSSEYSILMVHGDTTWIFSVENETVKCQNNRSVSIKFTEYNFSMLEGVDSLSMKGRFYQQSINEGTLIFSNHFVRILFIKKRGNLQYGYFSMPGCDLNMSGNDTNHYLLIREVIENLETLLL